MYEEWQPIDTAPKKDKIWVGKWRDDKNGRPPFWNVERVEWSDAYKGWSVIGGSVWYEPSHWYPDNGQWRWSSEPLYPAPPPMIEE